jgi:hypothetical protein
LHCERRELEVRRVEREKERNERRLQRRTENEAAARGSRRPTKKSNLG